MVRHAIIRSDLVVVTVVDYPIDITGQTPPGYEDGYVAIAHPAVGPDWTWDGTSFSAPPAPPPLPAEPVTRVTTNQARLALLAAGKLDQVDAYVATMGAAANTRWHYAAYIYRDSPLIAQAVADNIFTQAEIDELFEAAARIE